MSNDDNDLAHASRTVRMKKHLRITVKVLDKRKKELYKKENNIISNEIHNKTTYLITREG